MKKLVCARLIGLFVLGVFLFGIAAGCVSEGDRKSPSQSGGDELQSVLSESGFEVMRPPSSGWLAGSVVSRHDSGKGVLALEAPPEAVSQQEQSQYFQVAQVPSMNRLESDVYTLNAGIGLPESLGAVMDIHSVAGYYVSVEGGRISRVVAAPFVKDILGRMQDAYSADWASRLRKGELYYISEVWYCDNLEYHFVDAQGVAAQFDVIKLAAQLDHQWSARAEGSVVYEGEEPLAIGVRLTKCPQLRQVTVGVKVDVETPSEYRNDEYRDRAANAIIDELSNFGFSVSVSEEGAVNAVGADIELRVSLKCSYAKDNGWGEYAVDCTAAATRALTGRKSSFAVRSDELDEHGSRESFWDWMDYVLERSDYDSRVWLAKRIPYREIARSVVDVE